MSGVTTNANTAVTSETAIATDAQQAAAAGAQIAASVLTSNPVGIAVGSVEAISALTNFISNLKTLQQSGSLTQAQVDQIFAALNMQTANLDKQWQALTGSSAP